METVHDTDVVFETLAEVGLRAVVGKCMMDSSARCPAPGGRRPRPLTKAWLRRAGPRCGRPAQAAFAPRFAVSCSRELLEAVADLSQRKTRSSTHASESRDEVDVATALGRIQQSRIPGGHGARDASALRRALCVGDRQRTATVGRTQREGHALPGVEPETRIGLAPVVEMRKRGISVSLGADGAACNNRLDMFDEMRLAATLQAVRKGPGVLPARDVVWMATREGARALGMDSGDRIDRARKTRRPHPRRPRSAAPGARRRSLFDSCARARPGRADDYV